MFEAVGTVSPTAAGSPASDASWEPASGPPWSATDLLPPDPHPDPDLARLLADPQAWVEPSWWPAASPTEAPPAPAAADWAGRIPCGWLAGDLDRATTELSGLSDAELIEAVVGWENLACWAAGRQQRVLAEFSRRRPGDDPAAVNCPTACASSQWAPDEIGLALRCSRGSAMARLVTASQLTGPLVATLELLETGRLDLAKARAICERVAYLDPEVAVAVQQRVLGRAPEQTLAQLKAALARAVLAADPAGAARRHRQARAERHVRLTERDDGMASLWALLAAPDAVACFQWLTRLARGLGGQDPRDIHARRADLLVELLTGRLTLHDTGTGTGTGTGTDSGTAAEAEAGVEADLAVGADDTADADAGAEAGAEAAGAEAAGAEAAGAEAAGAAASAGAAAPAAPGGNGGAADVPAGGTATAAERESADGAATGDRAGGQAGKAPGVGCPGTAARRPPPAGKAVVHVTVPYTTLLGVEDLPGELAGYGPIPADLAREIAADGVWKRLVTDPLSGALLDHGRTTYRPPVALAEFVRARDGCCRFPTCRRRVDDCELDHIQPWAEGGITAEPNLAAGCTGHHHVKHQPGWRVRMRPGPGRILEWTTPTGHIYLSDPADYRPTSDPDPPLIRPTTSPGGEAGVPPDRGSGKSGGNAGSRPGGSGVQSGGEAGFRPGDDAGAQPPGGRRARRPARAKPARAPRARIDDQQMFGRLDPNGPRRPPGDDPDGRPPF